MKKKLVKTRKALLAGRVRFSTNLVHRIVCAFTTPLPAELKFNVMRTAHAHITEIQAHVQPRVKVAVKTCLVKIKIEILPKFFVNFSIKFHGARGSAIGEF